LKELSTTDLIAQRMINTVKWVNIKSKTTKKELIRSLLFRIFFGYKQKKTYQQIFVISQQGFFLILSTSLYGKLQNINPIKVDKNNYKS
jgi:hypothetical protein